MVLLKFSGSRKKNYYHEIKCIGMGQKCYGAVFLNDEPDAVKDFMDSHQENQKYIDFYFTKEFPYPTTIPQTFIVDKAGTIRKVGNILNVEKIVNQLLNENQEIQKNKVCFQIDQKQMHYFFIYANIQFRKLANSNIIEFQFNFNLKKIHGILYAEDPNLTYYARETQTLQLQNILSKLFGIIPENLWKITKTIEETIQIPYPGKQCTVCQQYIANQPQQYYCPFKQEHVCTQCAEADDKQQQGNKRFKYYYGKSSKVPYFQWEYRCSFSTIKTTHVINNKFHNLFS